MDISKAPVSAAAEELRRKSSSFAWIYSFVELEEIKFGVVKMNRSFPYGEGEGGWGLMNSIVVAQGCDARDDEKNYY